MLTYLHAGEWVGIYGVHLASNVKVYRNLSYQNELQAGASVFLVLQIFSLTVCTQEENNLILDMRSTIFFLNDSALTELFSQFNCLESKEIYHQEKSQVK